MKKITILGTGAYGKALAQILCGNGYQVMLWGVVEQEINDINNHKANDIILERNMAATSDLEAALANSPVIIFAVPAKSVDSVSKQINAYISKPVLIINATKGFDPTTGQRLSVIIKNNLKNKSFDYAGIYGPSLAGELIKLAPTQITAVSEEITVAQEVKKLFNNSNFSLEISTDLSGVESWSAVKNVIGIIAGILTAQKISDSTFAAIIAIAINEGTKYIVKQGGKLETILTQAGIGDLMLSCALPNSRNFKFGYQIGTTTNPKTVIDKTNYTVEGFLTSQTIHHEKVKLKLELPLFDLLYQILFENHNPNIIVHYFKNLK